MQWTRSETLALAQQSCTHCYGLGLRPGRAGVSTPCNCVFRAIFRACHARFRQCASKEKYISRVSLEANPGRQRRSVWGLKNEEFMADFCLVSKRTLDELQHKIFTNHFLLGADWKLCCRKLGMERGAFFHEVYRIEQKLGRTFRELEPLHSSLWTNTSIALAAGKPWHSHLSQPQLTARRMESKWLNFRQGEPHRIYPVLRKQQRKGARSRSRTRLVSARHHVSWSKTEGERCRARCKKVRSRSPHSAASSPSSICKRWFSNSESARLNLLLTAPKRMSLAAKTSLLTRAATRAPAHMTHGSTVEKTEAPSRR